MPDRRQFVQSHETPSFNVTNVKLFLEQRAALVLNVTEPLQWPVVP